MLTEVPQAISEAIKIAPVDPQYYGPDDDRVTRFVDQTIDTWSNAEPELAGGLNQLKDLLTPLEQEALTFYLASTAFAIADAAPPLEKPQQEIKERATGVTLFKNLTSGEIESERDAFRTTWQTVYPENLSFAATATFTRETVLSQPEIPDLDAKLAQLKADFAAEMQTWKDAGKTPEMRDMLSMKLKLESKYPNLKDYMFDLTIGDVDLVSNPVEPEYSDVPERMGFTGEKLWRIDQRAKEYQRLLRRAGVNITGYQPIPLGWNALITRGLDYLGHYGMNGYQNEGCFMDYGGSYAMDRAFLLAKRTLSEEGVTSPTALFPTPGFMMMKDVAENTGLKTMELVTKPEDHFLPTPDKLKEILLAHPEIKILVLTPINNPGSHVAEAERIKQILDMLEGEQQFKDIIVINDLAYLGTGDKDQNTQLGKTLNQRRRRIDVLAWTKLLGRPGLRCATAGTPDPEIAKWVKPVARNVTLAISYPMQAETLAVLDFVKLEDMERLYQLYRHRQEKMIETLKLRPDLFDIYHALVTTWDAALYAFVPLANGVDPLDIMPQTGLFGTSARAFYASVFPDIPNYIRFALGKQPITEQTIDRMRKMMS
ncbi:hypothetical protein A2960_02675 [Candidatus Gottesmanbacteria bacterium RIFCSPLOWO2_01_FULL_39_12b]|uniref:Aminotransferase class I/classII large domain-containing protein n=1 Tax=Candidatus Gottesmanbacteria bacterium RIFCSPLOWO2_01_FULL_39_12b TaxID=1798388 RepID=A0A1F6AQQ1_9BACT|nr:MAG: hypothetical protein A2960_02675 [Candidatus Gottesmanbacteria bacterium RIFCSPLOWO2_01_FULL_39_12b]